MTKPSHPHLTLLTSALARVPGCTAVLLEGVVPASDTGWRPDSLVEVQGTDRPKVLLALKLYKAVHPGTAQAQRLLAQDWQRQCRPDATVVFGAPYLSTETRELLFKHGVSTLDEAGNALLNVAGIVVDKEVPGNPFRTRRAQKSLFTPQAFQVIKQLLLEPRVWSGSALAAAAGVSMGHVSQLRQKLVEHGWLQSSRKAFTLSNPEALLSAWRASKGPASNTTSAYTLLHGQALDEKVQQVLTGPDGSGVLLTGASCARWVAPFVRGHELSLLVLRDAVPIVLGALGAQEVQRGGNVTLWVSEDEALFREPLELPQGLKGSDLLTTYWMLANQGERFAEAAEHLATQLIRPRWLHRDNLT